MKKSVEREPDRRDKEGLTWLSAIRALGWDLDGTLSPADAIPSSVIRELQINKIVTARSWSVAKAVGEFEEAVRELGSTTKALTRLGVDGPGFFRTLWDELPLERYLKKDERLMKMFQSLASYRHVMISNSNTVPQIHKKLRLLGLDPSVFAGIISTDEMGVVKPDPEPFLAGLVTVHVEPYEMLYVGDRVETDVVGAKGVGIKTCLVGKTSDEADVCLEDVFAITTLFG